MCTGDFFRTYKYLLSTPLILLNSFYKLNKMRVVYFLTVLVLIGCNKNNEKIDLLKDLNKEKNLVHNLPITIHASESIDIRASDVLTSSHSIKRKIEFIDRYTDIIKDTFIISMDQIDTSMNFIASIKEKKFIGELTIESDNIILYNIKIDKWGILPKKILNSSQMAIKPSRVNTCKFNLVHGCVSNEIKKMGIFEYAACLYTAPECYALLWAGCAFNYCVTGEQK